MEKNYSTLMRNNTKRAVMVYELDGPLVELQPGQDFVVESRNPATLYARWSQVTWREDSLSFLPRPGFTEPERGRWTIRLLNRDGGDGQKGPDGQIVPIETRMVGGKLLLLPKGVPILVGLKLDDPLVRFKSLTVSKKRVMLKDDTQPGYIIHEWRSTDDKVERSASELKAIEQLLSERK